MKSAGVFLCVLALFSVSTSFKSYSGYQVLRTVPLKNVGDLLSLQSLMANLEYDFWSAPRLGYPTDIMTSPEHVKELTNELSHLGLEPSVIIPDMGVVVEREREIIYKLRANYVPGTKAPILDRYLTFDEIQAYLLEVVTMFPNIASIITIGTSYEGRPLNVLKLSNGPGKSGIFFDAAVHAREWLGPPVLLYSINELTENLAVNQAMLDRNDFYFLPVANPDGYEFSWVDSRLWRKTRSPNTGSSCIGTDANRNFDIHWGEGGIPDACSDTYPGAMPFSEPEAKAIADFFTANTDVTFYVSVHSYGQYLLYPWGFTYDLPPNGAELDALATEAAIAITSVYGTPYTIGSIANVLYFAYGGSIDWTLGVEGVAFSYAFELPGGGLLGFNPPPEDIIPVATETWEGIKVFAANIPPTRQEIHN